MKKKSRPYFYLKEKIISSKISSVNEAILFFKENINKENFSYRLSFPIDFKGGKLKLNISLPNSSEINKIVVMRDGLDERIINSISANNNYNNFILMNLSEFLLILKKKNELKKNNFSKFIVHKNSEKILQNFKSVLSKKKMYPNKKSNTLVDDAGLIKEIESFNGRDLLLSSDKDGNVSLKFGDNKMSSDQLLENYEKIMGALYSYKSTIRKDIFFKSVVISTTNSPGILISL